MSLTISSKGWVVIPAELRKKYNLEPGDKVQVVDYGEVLSLVPILDHPVRDAGGKLLGKRSLTKALLKAREAERRRER